MRASAPGRAATSADGREIKGSAALFPERDGACGRRLWPPREEAPGFRSEERADRARRAAPFPKALRFPVETGSTHSCALLWAKRRASSAFVEFPFPRRSDG